MAFELQEGKIGDPALRRESHLIKGSDAPIQRNQERHQLETLDEPITDTVIRDLKRIGVKLRHVLLSPPTSGMAANTARELRDWDLWGPLLLCLTLASSMSWSEDAQGAAAAFGVVFVLVWCGAGIVTLNAALLGGTISFLHSVCVLGYCLCPLPLASILCHFLPDQPFVIRLVVVSVAFLWATRASVSFMGPIVPTERRALAVFPLVLFYFTIAWMVYLQ